MKVILKYVLPIFTCFLSLAAVIIGSVAVAKAYKEPEVYNAYQLKLKNFFATEASDMYVDSEWNPYMQGRCYDKEVVSRVQNEMRELLLYTTYTPAKKPKYNSKAAGSGEFGYIIFSVDGTTYLVSAVGDNKLKISVGGDPEYYFADCWCGVSNLIDKTVEELFGV